MGAISSATQLSIACLSVLSMFMGGCSVFGPRPHTSYEANNQVLALNQLVVFQNSTGSLSYHAPTGKDVRVNVAPRVKGKACQQGIQIPIPTSKRSAMSISAGWGRGAYEEALNEARAGLPRDAVLYDVRADLNSFSILTVYHRLCLLVNAAVALPVQALPNPATTPSVPVPPPSQAPPSTQAPAQSNSAPAQPLPAAPQPPGSEPTQPAPSTVPPGPAPAVPADP